MGTMTNEVLKKGERASLISLLTSLFLIIIKAGIGLITGSLVLISDAFNSGADTLTMIMSWFGFKISQRKPDRTFHYGYYKAESLAAFFISVSIVYAA
ncbi:MAG: cation diffusion facilitator family transporter, partial [Candidatus Aenigmarchaeota archaeon]|nr:cation diffusion facilitator family transporter [Candidatus Aenigmarchaeota archaeon]